METPSLEQLPTPTDDATLVQRLTPILLLILAVIVVFGRSVTFGVFWDDTIHLTTNPSINPPTWDGLVKIMSEPYQGLYIPLSYTYFWLLATIAGVPPENGTWLFHLSTLVLHTINTLLVYGILRRLIAGNRWAAFFGAALFAIHPLQTESVVWISETRGLLAGVFSLLSIRLYISFLDRAESATYWADRYVPLVASVVVFLLALLCKPAAVAVPIILGILAVGLYRRKILPTLLELTPYLLFVSAVILVSMREQPAERLPWIPPIWMRPMLALDAIAFYIGKLFWPHPLAADYGLEPSWMVAHTWSMIVWIIPVVLLIAAAVSRHRRALLVCFGLFVAWLLPVLGLVPFAFQRISLVADRYVYLAMLGPALLVAMIYAASEKWSRSKQLAAIYTGAGILVLLAAVSFIQAGRWSDNGTFLTHTQTVNPRSTVAGDNFARIAIKEGRYQDALNMYRALYKEHPRREMICKNLAAILREMGRRDEALEVLSEAVDSSPDWPQVRCALAELLSERGDIADAEKHYKAVLKLEPASVPALIGLGVIEQHRRRPIFAKVYYQEALRHDARNLTAMNNLAVAFEALGELEKAVDWHFQAIEIAPANAPSHYGLGNVLVKLERNDEALDSFLNAIKANPRHVQAHMHAAILHMNKEEFEEARKLLATASIIDPKNPDVFLNFGLLLLRTGNFLDARDVFIESRDLLHKKDPRQRDIDNYLKHIDELIKEASGPPEGLEEPTDQPPPEEPIPLPADETEPTQDYVVPLLPVPPAENDTDTSETEATVETEEEEE